MPTAKKSITPNPARALYENYMTGEYGKKWDDLPAGVQKRWADALAAGVIAMTSVRIEPVEDFDTEAFRAASLQPGTFAVSPEPTESIFSDGEPYAAMTVDYLGCEYLSRDVENIEKIAAAGSKGPTEVVYLYDRPQQHAPTGAVKALAKELEQLLDLLKDMPAVDRGYSWELRNSRGHEEIRAYGVNAKTFKFVIDNRDALISALSARVRDVAERQPKEIATWEDQQAFEAWAQGERYEMHQHPLHYLFMDPKTNAARQGWKAALQFIRDRSAAAPAKQEDGHD